MYLTGLLRAGLGICLPVYLTGLVKAGLDILSPSVSYPVYHPVSQCIRVGEGCLPVYLPVYLTGLVKAGLDILSPSISYRVGEGRARHPVFQCILQGC